MGSAPDGPKLPAEALPAIKVGDVVLDRYRVIEHIATGGHSVVFRGEDERLSRPVCVKVFSGLGGHSGVGRTSYEHFVQEAFALSRLTHPNTLRIYDFGHLGPKDVGGMPIQVCEYMNGGTLSNIIREKGNQSIAETVRITSAMCAALAEAHGLGIVHRDIKPQNILFGTVGVNQLPKLADFGIAKWSADAETESSRRADDTAIVAGQKLAMYSPSWAAPEQLAGQPVSAATDIYSLACVAVYMLSSKAIFSDEDVYAGYKKRRHAEELVRDALAPLAVPRNIIDVLSRALAFDPRHRLGKIEELATRIAVVVDDAASELRTEPFERPNEPVPQPAKKLETRSDPPAAARAPSPSLHNAITPPLASPRFTPNQPAREAPREPPNEPPREPDPIAPAVGRAPSQPLIVPPPKSWSLPPVVQPWMNDAPQPGGVPIRVALADTPTPVGDRRLQFVMATNNVADLAGNHQTKVRVTLMPGPGGGRVLHLKGLTCFVSHVGGRPSPAVQIDQASDVALVTPRAQEIGHIRVTNGAVGIGQTVFAIGNDLIAIGHEDCMDAIMFDFGPGSDAYFVYTRGRTLPRSRRG